MSAYQIFTLPSQQALDTAANVLSGATLTFSLTGTSTPTNAYSDSTLSTPVANPLSANAAGVFAPIFLDPLVSYRIVLKTAAGAVLQTWDPANENVIAYFTQSVIGAILYPRTTAEIAATVTPVNYSYPELNLRRYGGDPTGVGTSDAAMASAIAVATAAGNGGRILCPGPSANYKFASQISLATKFNVIIEGDCGPTQGAYGTRFTYTGTGTGIFINMDSASACQIRGIQVTHSSASFTGTYIRCNNDGTHGDPTQCAVIDCSFGNIASATIALDLNKCIEFTADRCTFGTGNPSIRGMQSGGYSNVVRIRDCQFLNCTSAPIQEGGQAWIIEGCTFENLSTGAPGGISVSALATQFQGLTVMGCWFGDATSTAGTWIDIYGEGVLIAGNYIAGNATGSTGIKLRQTSNVKITANEFAVLLAGIDFATATCSNVSVENNLFNTVTTAFVNDSNVIIGTLEWGPNSGSNIPGSHASFATNGFCADGSTGMIEQWGLANATTNTPATVTFPKAFPNACLNVVCTMSAVTGNQSVTATSLSTTGFTVTVGGTAGANTVYWRARGY